MNLKTEDENRFLQKIRKNKQQKVEALINNGIALDKQEAEAILEVLRNPPYCDECGVNHWAGENQLCGE